jgi:hypothetical protein
MQQFDFQDGVGRLGSGGRWSSTSRRRIGELSGGGAAVCSSQEIEGLGRGALFVARWLSSGGGHWRAVVAARDPRPG